jgi:mRNA-degrading endonuclease RelE of RelBE toxin-antitoxin system
MARRNYNSAISPMSWHLVFALTQLVLHCGESLHLRLNLISEILGDIDAKKNGMKKAKDLSDSDLQEIEERLLILRNDFSELRIGYQPTMENAQYIYGKMGTYEIAYDAILTEIKSVIEEFNLLDKDDLKEIALPGAAYSRVNGGGSSSS